MAKKLFKVQWTATVQVKREAWVEAENEAKARDQFDNGNEFDTRDLDELAETDVKNVVITEGR